MADRSVGRVWASCLLFAFAELMAKVARAGAHHGSRAIVGEQARDYLQSSPTTRRPARDFVGPVSARTCLRSGQYPAFRPYVPPHPCSYLGRSRLRIVPESASGSRVTLACQPSHLQWQKGTMMSFLLAFDAPDPRVKPLPWLPLLDRCSLTLLRLQ